MPHVTGTGFKVIIPARLASTRLPQKPLLDIGGKPLLQHVYEAARKSAASAIIIATDSAEICARAESFGARVQMTAATHQSGTERLIEVIETLKEPDNTVIVNLQGDEFSMPPALVDQVAVALHEHPQADMATLCEPITEENDFNNPNIVKVIFDRKHNALDFTRHPVAWFGDGPAPGRGIYGYRHIGIYAYRAGFLRKYAGLEPCAREIEERLEQLRVLEHGGRIYVAIACARPGLGIDTPEDLEKARNSVASC
jgi:3-deoxy-manno-octulosonate cytidylyltransferase (CMP-KDO synthetase)